MAFLILIYKKTFSFTIIFFRHKCDIGSRNWTTMGTKTTWCSKKQGALGAFWVLWISAEGLSCPQTAHGKTPDSLWTEPLMQSSCSPQLSQYMCSWVGVGKPPITRAAQETAALPSSLLLHGLSPTVCVYVSWTLIYSPLDAFLSNYGTWFVSQEVC